MARLPFTPEDLRHRPFTLAEARASGVTSRLLVRPTWRRLFPRVWVHADHQMTTADTIAAAQLALPARAQLSHLSRVQALGLDLGDVAPVHFTIAGDHHLAFKSVFLHRTEVLPPLDDIGVTPAAAFIQHCATSTLLEAIIVGDWLLHRRHMTKTEVLELVRLQDWRPGADQAERVIPHLDAAARSPRESELRVRLVFAGLPRPEVNVSLVVGGERIGIVDLLIRCVMLVLEYEGRQHAESVAQFNRDIGRYAAFRRHDVEYLQITNEMLERPKTAVLRVHDRMRELGYEGPPPVFGDRWDALAAGIPRRTPRWAVAPLPNRASIR